MSMMMYEINLNVDTSIIYE